jgi:hypothetical protein
MTFTEAAAEVLRLAGKPLHYKEITELAIEKNLLSHVGKSPEITMGARLAALLKKEDKTNPIVRVKPGVFALREWDGKKGRKAAKEEPAPEPALDDEDIAVNALEVDAMSAPPAAPAEEADEAAAEGADDEDDVIIAGDVNDGFRPDLAASGADIFDDEEDDDQPILGPATAPAGSAPALDPTGEGGRRRRRRRRRGRGGQGELGATGERPSAPRVEGQAAEAEEAPRDPLAPAPRPQVRDRQQIMAGGAPTGIDIPLGEGDELGGRELADAAALVLGSFDRSGGAVPVRNVAEALARRGRLAGEPAAATVQLTASLRADNLRRGALGQRPRFRFSNGARVALTDWLLGPDLTRLEQDALAAAERYREAARRLLLRRVQELPGQAFVELALVALERAGMSQLRAVRRPGATGGEAHFQAVHRTGSDEIRTAIIVRKDGREIGRERVTDLRGALHHYGPAAAGWLITTGQVLSGARDEATAVATQPVSVFDGPAFCRLLEDHDVGVTRTRISLPLPDLELFEILRG